MVARDVVDERCEYDDAASHGYSRSSGNGSPAPRLSSRHWARPGAPLLRPPVASVVAAPNGHASRDAGTMSVTRADIAALRRLTVTRKPTAAPAKPTTPITAVSKTTTVIKIRRGNTLYGLAGRITGDPHRWQKLRVRNVGATMSDGTRLTNGFVRIRPGSEPLMTGSSTRHDHDCSRS